MLCQLSIEEWIIIKKKGEKTQINFQRHKTEVTQRNDPNYILGSLNYLVLLDHAHF